MDKKINCSLHDLDARITDLERGNPLGETFVSKNSDLKLNSKMLDAYKKMKKPLDRNQVAIAEKTILVGGIVNELNELTNKTLSPTSWGFTEDEKFLRYDPRSLLNQLGEEHLIDLMNRLGPDSLIIVILAGYLLEKVSSHAKNNTKEIFMSENVRHFLRTYCGYTEGVYNTVGSMTMLRDYGNLPIFLEDHLYSARKLLLNKKFEDMYTYTDADQDLKRCALALQHIQADLINSPTLLDDEKFGQELDNLLDIEKYISKISFYKNFTQYLSALASDTKQNQCEPLLKQYKSDFQDIILSFERGLTEGQGITSEIQTATDTLIAHLNSIVQSLYTLGILQSSSVSGDGTGTYESRIRNNMASRYLQQAEGQPDLNFGTYNVGNDTPSPGEQKILIELTVKS